MKKDNLLLINKIKKYLLEQNHQEDDENSELVQNKTLSTLFKKWKEQSPTTTYQAMYDMIIIFDRRKQHFRPVLKNRDDIPELYSFSERFPDFPCDNVQKLRDIQNYSLEQISFLTDRFVEREDTLIKQLEHTEDIGNYTYNEKRDYFIEKWRQYPGKVLDADNIIVCKVLNTQHSIFLGALQNLIKDKHHSSGHNWCTTFPDSTNYFSKYRHEGRSFYYVLDFNLPENHRHFICAIQPSVNGGYDYTDASNNLNTHVNDPESIILQYHPKLRDHMDIFKYYKITKEEEMDLDLSNINFIKGHANDFTIQSPALQKAYILSGKNINSERAFKSLSKDLIKLYVRITNASNVRKRFINTDGTHPFAILYLLPKSDLNYLDSVLLGRSGFKNGLIDLKIILLRQHYGVGYVDGNTILISTYTPRDGLFRLKYGVLQVDEYTTTRIKGLYYDKVKIQGKFLKFERDPETNIRKNYMFIKFQHQEDPDDYFYWKTNTANIFDSKYLTKSEGDLILNS